MLKKNILFASVLSVVLCLHGFAQTAPDANQKAEQDKLLKKHRNDSLRHANTNLKPTIGIGAGIFNFFGDVNHNKSVNPMVPSYGFNINVGQHFSPSFRLDLDFVMGSLIANERSVERNLNFKSRVINGSAQLTYTFAGILKPDRIMNPYISVGIGVLNFDSKGDWKADNDSSYNYWNDGSIRNVAQTSPSAENAITLERDYNYETDLRQANLDGLGKYSQVAFTVPISFGFDFKVSDRLRMKLGSTFYYAFTDNIDNVSSAGSGVRKGDDAKDLYLFSTFGIHYDFFSPVKKAPEGIYKDVDFTGIVQDDEDGDAVMEEADKCPGTPKEAKVDKNGCPVDVDGDGIPDYADMEPNTAPGLPVDMKGYGLTDEAIANLYKDTLGTEHARIFEIYPSMRKLYRDEVKTNNDRDFNEVIKKLQSGQIKQKPVKQGNARMERIDTNNDKEISGVEANKMIEDFLEGDSGFTLSEVYEIIDYLFEQ